MKKTVLGLLAGASIFAFAALPAQAGDVYNLADVVTNQTAAVLAGQTTSVVAAAESWSNGVDLEAIGANIGNSVSVAVETAADCGCNNIGNDVGVLTTQAVQIPVQLAGVVAGAVGEEYVNLSAIGANIGNSLSVTSVINSGLGGS